MINFYFSHSLLKYFLFFPPPKEIFIYLFHRPFQKINRSLNATDSSPFVPQFTQFLQRLLNWDEFSLSLGIGVISIPDVDRPRLAFLGSDNY